MYHCYELQTWGVGSKKLNPLTDVELNVLESIFQELNINIRVANVFASDQNPYCLLQGKSDLVREKFKEKTGEELHVVWFPTMSQKEQEKLRKEWQKEYTCKWS